MKQFISVNDVKDIDALVSKALYYKKNPLSDTNIGSGKRIGLLFFNPSLRTRLSTQIAAKNLGMEPIVFDIQKDGWALEFEDHVIMNSNSTEHIRDAAPVLGSYFDIICIRTFPQLKNKDEDYKEHILHKFIEHCNVPVVSLESATLHPLQSLADIITIREHLTSGYKPKIVLTWAPHVKSIPQCVSNSFAEWINTWNKAEFVITHPEGYELSEQYTKGAAIEYNQQKALEDADFVYVKNWSSYEDYGKVLSTDPSWMLNDEKLKYNPKAKIMHCLPLRRNVELGEDIIESKRSLITEQAANRVWSAQAVLSEILVNIKSNLQE